MSAKAAPARILLVDDEVSIQRAVAPLLRSRGYNVDVAAKTCVINPRSKAPTPRERVRGTAIHQPVRSSPAPIPTRGFCPLRAGGEGDCAGMVNKFNLQFTSAGRNNRWAR